MRRVTCHRISFQRMKERKKERIDGWEEEEEEEEKLTDITEDSDDGEKERRRRRRRRRRRCQSCTGKHSARPALRGPFLALFSPSPGRKKNKKSEGPMGNAEM